MREVRRLYTELKSSLRHDYPLTPQIQPLDQSGMRRNDGLSIDQSGTIHVYDQNWRETCKKIKPIKSQ